MIRIAVNVLVFALIAVAALITVRIFGPMIEVRVLPPVRALEFAHRECVGDDDLLSGFLDKTIYPGGDGAEFLGMSLFTTDLPRKRLAWQRADLADSSPENRPPGEQFISLRVTGGCGQEVTVHTRHVSPITGFVLPMTWGPF